MSSGTSEKAGERSTFANEDGVKRTQNGLKLEPQPTDDPHDPLNWSLTKKITTLALVSFAAMMGYAQAHANQAGVVAQGLVYNKEPTQISNTISAAVAGLATGPVFAVALSNYVGRSSVIFWAEVLTIGCAIWSASMTGEGDYIPFAISRWLAGTFASAPSTLGGGIILDTFFLHQRGRAFAFFSACVIFGASFGATLSGFIVDTAPWPVMFWWTVAGHGLTAILVLLLLDDTTYPRDGGIKKREQSWLNDRIATFLPGSAVVCHSGEHHGPFDSIIIGLQPVTMLAGLFLTTTFGWAVTTTTLLPVYLEASQADGGYGFTPIRVSYFTFVSWVSFLSAEFYGLAFNDRIALWSCRRAGGVWKPEHRLWPLLLPPFVILPSMLGLYGATLQYHLHYMVLAVSLFFFTSMELATVPIIINYISESFLGHPVEVTTILTFYRLILGLTVTFYIEPWTAAVGPGWVFGMMGCFSLLGFSMPAVLAWKGHVIRRWSSKRFQRSEEGDKLFQNPGMA